MHLPSRCTNRVECICAKNINKLKNIFLSLFCKNIYFGKTNHKSGPDEYKASINLRHKLNHWSLSMKNVWGLNYISCGQGCDTYGITEIDFETFTLKKEFAVPCEKVVVILRGYRVCHYSSNKNIRNEKIACRQVFIYHVEKLKLFINMFFKYS